MKDENRGEDGKFVAGNCANPTGRPKRPRAEKLEEAIKDVEEEKGTNLFKHFVERAYVSDGILAVLFRKLLPDLRAIDLGIGDDLLQKARKDEQDLINEALKLAREKEAAAKQAQELAGSPDAMAEPASIPLESTDSEVQDNKPFSDESKDPDEPEGAESDIEDDHKPEILEYD